MAPDRRRLVMLASILAIVSAIGLYQLWTPATPPGVPAPRPAARGGARAGTGKAAVSAPDVHLHALKAEKPAPDGDPHRDLFRFNARRAPEQPARAQAAPAPPPRTESAGPPAPPPLPPIAMRFIGLVEGADQARRIAILSDGRGIYQGREGDIIEGRYRILRIGVESVEMAYLDGRGRQTIRLSGS